ncbi:hypothetical protein [Haliangium sp.]|uniref:hypothetical protein n=1 Tax=Haliangium sp. TaxID=2663208 RepID=UPI003D152D1B
MKSTIWRSVRGPRTGLVALVFSATLALAWMACTKDAESQTAPPSPNPTASAPAPGAAAKAVPTGEAEAEAVPTGEAPAEAIPAGKTVGGDDSYTLTLDAPDKVAAGSDATVRISVIPKKGWKMNKEFPTKLQVTAPAGVTVSKAEQRVADAERFDAGGAVFAVSFKADQAGAQSFQAKFKFAVCTDATCDPKKQELAWVVTVE